MKISYLLFATFIFIKASFAQVDPAIQAKIDSAMKSLQPWGSDPKVVALVKAASANPSADIKNMTNEKWKELTVLDPFVRSFSKNELAEYLKSKKSDFVSECFVSAADGTKIAFFAKTTSWTHAGKPKHDLPLSGKTWQGSVEVDESTGIQQVQTSFPVLDGTKPIGSIVVGLAIAKLK